jgi:hypothetical protein
MLRREPYAAGAESLALTSLVWIVNCILHRTTLRTVEPNHRRRAWIGLALRQLVMLSFWAGQAATLALGAGGIYALVPGFLLG